MYDVASLCRPGGRAYNQDFVGHKVIGKLLIIAVADGLGSYHGSDVASRTAVNFILEKFARDVENGLDVLIPDYATALISAAHKAVIEKKRALGGIDTGCTTIAVVITNSSKTVTAHIGDSRIYIIRDGKIVYRTRDHSLAQLAVDRGEITHNDLRHHKDQNKLLRVLGSERYMGPDTAFHSYKLGAGDGFVVVTDGWWEYVYESQTESLFNTDRTAEEIMTNLEGVITLTASEGNDNYSAVIARII